MNTRLLFIALCFALPGLKSSSQNTGFANLDINNVSARFNSCGNNFWDLDSVSQFVVPKLIGNTSIFNQALWIGGMDANGQLKLAAERYRDVGEDFWPGPISNSYDSLYDAKWNKVWKISKSTIDSFNLWFNNPSTYPNYSIPSKILSWPAHGNVANGQAANLAPFYDNDNNGTYNPNNGDHPLIKGDQTIFYIYNDARNIHTETGGAKLNVEIHVMAYAFNCNGPLGNTIFVNYKIFNRSFYNLFNTSIGIFVDIDLGFPYDDYIACDVKRGAFYCFDEDSFGLGQPPPNWTPPPVQAVVILGGSYLDSDGIDNPKFDSIGNPLCNNSINGLNFGDGIADNERLGLTKFISKFNTGGSTGPPPMYQPIIPLRYYNDLNGYWDDSTRISYGGCGHINGVPPAYGPACNFMYPGDSDPCNWGTGGIVPNGPTYWSEGSTGNIPYDRRGLGVTGPFTFGSGQMHELDLAYVWAQATLGGPFASVELMRLETDIIRDCFVKDSFPCSGPFTDAPYKTWEEEIVQGFTVYPNPSSDNITIKQGKNTNFKNYVIYDLVGQVVLSGKFDDESIININLLQNGLYFIKAYNENLAYTKKLLKQ